MRRRISIWGRARPTVRPSVRPSVRPLVPCYFRRWKSRILGASCAAYPALLFIHSHWKNSFFVDFMPFLSRYGVVVGERLVWFNRSSSYVYIHLFIFIAFWLFVHKFRVFMKLLFFFKCVIGWFHASLSRNGCKEYSLFAYFWTDMHIIVCTASIAYIWIDF